VARAWLAAQSAPGEVDEAFLASLAGVKGIGEWTSQYIALRAFRRPDAFPVNDLVLRRAAGEGSPLTAAALRERAERWRPWRAYAAIYLWRSAADAENLSAIPSSLTRGRAQIAGLGNATS
jgi:AraC family transcriptional regulator of adaptative response / DNA-3-methyladenine glycosylase II